VGDAPIRALRPVTSALELRDATVRDYKRAAEQMGFPADAEAIRKQAESDLTMVDRFTAEKPAAPDKKRDRSDRKTVKRVDELDQALGAIGGRTITDQPDGQRTRQRDRFLYGKPKKLAGVVWWWPHAMARIKRILAGARGASLVIALQDAAAPKLAREFMQHWAAMMQRRLDHDPTPGRPYDGMSDKDAERKFVRAVEDICDRSRVTLGPWRHL
jgi:hypothetical protein